MDRNTAKELIKGTFNFPFEENRFRNFAINLLNNLDEEKSFGYISGNYIKDKFKPHITKYRRLGTYTDPNEAKIDVLVVQIKNEWALERSRTALRNFTADYLSNRDSKDAALVAYFSSDPDDWRFSYIHMEYKLDTTSSGKVTVRKDITPAKRFSFLVGKNEPNHTAQAQLLPIVADDHHNPTLGSLEAAFSVDKVTKQFYQDYRGLYEKLKTELDNIISKDSKIAQEFKNKSITTANFSKKFMGQIVFLYFLQKKGWLGVRRNQSGAFDKWGQGPKNFLKRLQGKEFIDYENFFNDILEPLFYEALATDRPKDIYSRFDCKIPFLNGGLFEPLNGYNWIETDIKIDDSLFEEIFRTFDLYNFTVREDEPLETEVAVDPEMLGKVFENLIEDNERKGMGAFYTPRSVVHYMCQQSLINYLASKVEQVPMGDIETLIFEGDIILELESAINIGTQYQSALMDSIKEYALELDIALSSVKICDPAVGSGAFPVGMLTEIVSARRVLQLYLNNSMSIYDLKRHSIQNSLYGVDLDPGSIEIAKLRLWLSLVVDENDYNTIQPLPNLDYKIMQGNSLIEEFHGISLDIEKKEEQKNLFGSGTALDELIDDLHLKQAKFFNAEHPNAKMKIREDVENAIYQIFHSELQKKKSISKLEANEIEHDLQEMTHGNKVRNFFPWHLYYADVFRENDGFDILIANPPYIGQKGNNQLFREVKSAALGKYHQRRMDYFYFFIHLALQLSTKDGLISFITTNYYYAATYADILRQDIYKKASYLSIVDFNEVKIFDSAQGQHNTVFVIVNNPDKSIEYLAKSVTGARSFNSKNLDRILYSNSEKGIAYSSGSNSKLFEGKEKYIRYIPDIKSQVLTTIKSDNKTLSAYCDLTEGIHTGADKVSKNHKKKYSTPEDLGSGIFILTPDELLRIECNEEERGLIRPWYKNSDIQKWVVAPNVEKHLIYYSSKEKYANIPNVRRHLAKFKTILINRKLRSGTGIISEKDYDLFVKGDKYLSYVMNLSAFKRGDYYCISYPRTSKVFEGNKIVVPQRSYGNTFAFHSGDFYASADVYFIKSKNNIKLDLLYILAILNSSLIYFWLYHKGKRKGNMLELYIRPLSEIPIKMVGLDKQKPIVALVKKILAMRRDTPETNIIYLEEDLDRMVFELYSLTNDEIAIINNFNQK